MEKINVFIADDHEMFREGVKMLLSKSSEIEIIGEASNGKECLESLPSETDVILMDILMPEMDGIEATQKIIEKYPDVKIIALSMFGDQEYYYKMIHSGIKGFVLKEAGSRELEDAIQEVHKGGNFFSQEILRSVVTNLREPTKNPPKTSSSTTSFSNKETEILQHICSGWSDKEMAEALKADISSIENQKANLIRKAGVNNTVDLIVYAIKNGVVKI